MSGTARSGPSPALTAPLLAAVLALALPCGPAVAQDTAPAPETRGAEFVYSIPPEGITLDRLARDAEIATGRTFLLSDKSPIVGKTIRLAGEARVPAGQALGLFQALFVTQGYALKPLGDSTGRILVVESVDTSVDLKQRASFVTPAELDALRNDVGLVVMTFFPLKHVRVQNIRAALAQFLTAKAVELSLDVESANSVIVIGFAPTVFAVKQVIGVMDVPRTEADLRFDLLSLEHAVADEIEPIVKNLIESGGGPEGAPRLPAGRTSPTGDLPPPRIFADPRTNSLAVYAIEADMIEIRRIVAALDAEFSHPAENLRIFWLKHTNAEDMADVLSESYGFTRSGGSARSAGGRPSERGAARGGAGDARARSTGGRAAAPSGSEDVLVIPEPGNNALIIRASRTAYPEVEETIRTLDRERAQVLIRGAVAEMTDEQFKSIGVEIAALQGGDGRYHAGALTGFGLSSLQISEAGPITGTGPGSGTGTGGGMGGGSASQTGDPSLVRIPFFPSTPGGGVFGVFHESLEVPLLISMLQDGDRGNIVSTPILVANDHTQSSIQASTQIPTVVFQSTQTGDESSFGGYQEAKIALTVSPHVSNDNYVQLEIELLVEAFIGARDLTGSVPPDKTSRQLIGSVTVRDGATAVIGGLILDNDQRDLFGVPPFAEAALIGPLMRRTANLCQRTSLYFFLSPTIIRRLDTLERISYERKLEVQKLQGPVRLIDPDFRPILLDHPRIGIDGIEASGNLDVPRYATLVPLTEPPGPPAANEPPGRSR